MPNPILLEDIEKRQANVIDISDVCSQNCIFCSGYPKKKIITKNVKKLIDKADKEVFFQGGEPTLQPKLINLIKYAKKQGKKTTLVTNGLRLAYRQYTKKLFESGLDQILFAFPAPTKKLNDFLSNNKNSFKCKCQALNNIIDLKQANNVRLVYVINKYNKNEIIHFLKFINENFKGINSVEFKLMQGLGNFKKNVKLFPLIEDFVDELNEAITLATKMGIKIQTNGIPLCYLNDNFKCAIEYYMKSHNMGNLSGRGFLDKCNKCSQKKYCMGYRLDYIQLKTDKKRLQRSIQI